MSHLDVELNSWERSQHFYDVAKALHDISRECLSDPTLDEETCAYLTREFISLLADSGITPEEMVQAWLGRRAARGEIEQDKADHVIAVLDALMKETQDDGDSDILIHGVVS